MKMYFFTILILFHLNNLFCQKTAGEIQVKIDVNSIYIVCRGTNSKIGFISDYNLKDKNITHVGIGIVENNKMKIYHVNNEESKNGSLFIQNLTEFKNPFDISYLAIWKYKSNEPVVKKLKTLLSNYSKLKITFDMDFNENGKQKLYCSEFCATVLNELNRKLYRFYKVKKSLNLIYRKVLERDTVIYYPVDFFETNKKFKKIYEQKY